MRIMNAWDTDGAASTSAQQLPGQRPVARERAAGYHVPFRRGKSCSIAAARPLEIMKWQYSFSMKLVKSVRQFPLICRLLENSHYHRFCFSKASLTRS